jgi:hypothetical protein
MSFFCDLSVVNKPRFVYNLSPFVNSCKSKQKEVVFTMETVHSSPFKKCLHFKSKRIATPLQYKGVAQHWLFGVYFLTRAKKERI